MKIDVVFGNEPADLISMEMREHGNKYDVPKWEAVVEKLRITNHSIIFS